MVKSINIIRRIGSKQNDIKYFQDLLPTQVDTIVEPFGGSFAVSKFFYKDINKYNFHINDLDEHLFYIYTHYQDYLNEFEKVNNFYKSLPQELTYTHGKEIKDYITKLECNENIKEYLIKNFIIRSNIFRGVKNYNFDQNEKQILDNGLFTNQDYKIIFDKYKDDENAFIFLDPPYLFSDNSGYYPQNVDKDMTQILIDILEFIKRCKCYVMLIINKLNIIEYLFKDFIKDSYNKTYQMSKKKMKHLIICNY